MLLGLLLVVGLPGARAQSAQGSGAEIWQGRLDPDLRAAVLAAHANQEATFDCSGVTLRVHADGTAEIPGTLWCTITLVTRKPTGMTWSKYTYEIAFTPAGQAPLNRLTVSRVVKRRLEYVENGRRGQRDHTGAPETVPVTVRDDGSDRLLNMNNGITGVIRPVPWRILGRRASPGEGTGKPPSRRGDRGAVDDETRKPPPPPPPPPPPSDPPIRRWPPPGPGAGPYHEFAAMCRFGWASALARYSVGPADRTIMQHLEAAGQHMRAANETTFSPLRAWPNWSSHVGRLNAEAERLSRDGDAYRETLAGNLSGSWRGLARELAYQAAGEVLPRENCDSLYAETGYQLCFAQEALQIAEAAERQGEDMMRQIVRGEAQLHLAGARAALNSLPSVPLASGRCVDLREVASMLSRDVPTAPLSTRVPAINDAIDRTLDILSSQTEPMAAAPFRAPWTAQAYCGPVPLPLPPPSRP